MTRCCLFLIPLLVSSAACSSAEDVVDAVGVDVQAEDPVARQPEAEAVAFDKTETRNGATFQFTYEWPAEVSMETKLATALARERDEALASERAEWLSYFEGSDDACPATCNYGYGKEWKVVANLPRFLSLSIDVYSYTGGAHGNYGKGGLVWDRKAGADLLPVDFFRSPQGFADAVRSRYCTAIDAMREERRGMPVDETGDDMFDVCPAIPDLTILLGSSDGKRFNRIGLVADPYVAGPYAEGYYEVTLPVDAAIIDAVKPEYQGAFALASRKTPD